MTLPGRRVPRRSRTAIRERALAPERDSEAREAALSAFLDEHVARGFRIESRTDTQAIIVSPSRFSFLPARFRRSNRRQVVSVDADGVVTSRPAEPLRW